MKLRFIAFLFAILSVAGWGPFLFLNDSPSGAIGSEAWINDETRKIGAEAHNLDTKVLKLSLSAFAKAHERGLVDRKVMTIIDYSKPSTERRLWVVDLESHKVLFNTWVSHGKNSGKVSATSFSNRQSSLQSALGVMLTEGTYTGGNGYSLRLIGLERGINDNVLQRRVVVHGAWYADPEVIKTHGQLGRSWGCPAVSDKIAKPLIDTIKNNTLLFAYYPDQQWLRKSRFLAG